MARDVIAPATGRRRFASRPALRVFDTYEVIIEAACEAWRNLLVTPAPSPQPAIAFGFTSVKNEAAG